MRENILAKLYEKHSIQGIMLSYEPTYFIQNQN